MKKKLLTTVAVTTIVCAAAFTLFGCGGNEKPVTYTVTYEKGASDATGTAPAAVSYAEGAEITVAANTFTRTGYTFKTWSDGTATYAAGAKYTMPAKNVTFTAQWELATVQFSVVFKDGETTVATRTVTEGSEVELPDPPDAPAGKVFGGWFIKDTDTEVTEGYQPTQDLEVVARWDDAYTLTFKNGEEVYRTVVVVAGDKVRLPLAPEAKEGETFGGWFIKDTDTEVTADFVPEADAEIVAKWNKKQQVTVTFKNGETVVKTQTVFAGDTVTLPTENPTKPAFTFKGWQTPEGAVFDATKPVNASVELNPIWEIAFAGAWTMGKNSYGVEIIAKNGADGIVGYALDMDADGILFELKETELGFVARPIGLPASMVQGMRVLFEYSEEEDPELTISAIDEHDEVVPQSVRTYANVSVMKPYIPLNGTYKDADPQDPEKVATVKFENGALTVTNMDEFAMDHVLNFGSAAAYFGAMEEEGESVVLIAENMDPNQSVEEADTVWVVYFDTTMTSGSDEVMYVFRKDLAVWGKDQVAFHELKKGQTISYTATIDSTPTEAWFGMLAQIKADGINGNSYFIRQDGYALLNPWVWSGSEMTATWATPFDADKYKANAKGATVDMTVSLAADGTLTVKVDFDGGATTDKYTYSVTYTAVAKTTTAQVAFAHEGVTVKENGYTALPFGQYQVNYQLSYGSLPEGVDSYQTVEVSDTGVTKITLPTPVMQEGFVFKGWLVGESTTPVAAGTEITLGAESHVEIRAEVKKQVTVSFKVQDGKTATGEMADVTIEVDPNGGTYTLPVCTFEVAGETFDHWEFNGSHVSGEINVNGDITLVAKFVSASSVFRVSFYDDLNGSLVEPPKNYANDGSELLQLPANEPTKKGFAFLGWFVVENDNYVGNAIDANDLPKVEGNMTIAAKWEQLFTVTYFKNIGDSEAYDTQDQYRANDTLTLPTEPQKAGYRFMGWFVVENNDYTTTQYTGGEVVTENVELFAKWEVLPTSAKYSDGVNEEEIDLSQLTVNDNGFYTVTVKENTGTKEGAFFVGYQVAVEESNGDRSENLVFPNELLDIKAGTSVTITPVWQDLAIATPAGEYDFGVWGQALPNSFTLASGHSLTVTLNGYEELTLVDVNQDNAASAVFGLVVQLMQADGKWYFFQGNTGTAFVNPEWNWVGVATITAKDANDEDVNLVDNADSVNAYNEARKNGKTVIQISLAAGNEGYVLTAVTSIFAKEGDGFATNASFVITRTINVTDSQYTVYLAMDSAKQSAKALVDGSVVMLSQSQTATADTPITIGLNNEGANVSAWLSRIHKGEKITLSGIQTAAGDNGWLATGVGFYNQTATSGMYLRPDRWIDGSGDPNWSASHQWVNSGEGLSIAVAIAQGTFTEEGDEFAHLNLIRADCKLEVIIDWTEITRIRVSLQFTDKNNESRWVRSSYTIEATDSAVKALADCYNFSLGYNTSTATITSLVRSSK